jgi:hypothetical protein
MNEKAASKNNLTSPLIDFCQSIDAPALTSQKSNLIWSSFHGPVKREEGISTVGSMSALQLQSMITSGLGVSQ